MHYITCDSNCTCSSLVKGDSPIHNECSWHATLTCFDLCLLSSTLWSQSIRYTRKILHIIDSIWLIRYPALLHKLSIQVFGLHLQSSVIVLSALFLPCRVVFKRHSTYSSDLWTPFQIFSPSVCWPHHALHACIRFQRVGITLIYKLVLFDGTSYFPRKRGLNLITRCRAFGQKLGHFHIRLAYVQDSLRRWV